MSTILEALQLLSKPLLLPKEGRNVRIDEWTFRIHYRTTAILLFLFSSLLCLREYLGDHIKCVQTDEDLDYPDVPKNVLQSYCFIKTTFTVPYQSSMPRHFKANRRVFALLGGPGHIPGKTEKVHHAYYQWTPFFLFFQAVLFYMPHAYWKYCESGRLKNLVQDLNIKRFLLERSEKCSHTTAVAKYLARSKGHHVLWATQYIIAEFGNLFVVLGCMYLTDVFLAYEFSSFGPKVLSLVEKDHSLRDDPMTRVFPRITKCNLNRFGASGSIQRFDALCVLSSNILNEKIFTFLWFWYVIVAVITIISVIYRVATLFSFGLRLSALGSASDFPEKPQGKYVLSKLGRSDWLLLRFVRLNMDSITFYQLVRSIHEEMMLN